MNDQYGLGESIKKSKMRLLYLLFMLAVTLIAMSYATQHTAELYGYHKALGNPVYKQFYWPWMIVIWFQKLASSESLNHIIAIAQVIFIGPQIVVIGISQFFLRKPEGVSDIHGTAHWANKKEITKAGLLEGTGVYVGGWQNKNVLNYLRHNGPEHIMVFAPTRSGKGVGLVLPTLLSWDESSIVLDIKGENWALTSGWRKSHGHKVLKFDPTDTSGNSARYNPLSEVRLDGPQAIPDAQNIANMIVDPDGKGLKDYWNKAAFGFLGGAILHCMILLRVTSGQHATLNDLSLMLADEDKEMTELFDEMLGVEHHILLVELFGPEISDSATAIKKFISAAAREMLNKSGAELSGVVSTAVANMALYRDPVVARSTSGCDFKISDLMNNDSPISLYLVIRPSDIDRLRPLIRLILNMVLRRLTENMEFQNGSVKECYKHRLLLMLDEFTSLGKMEIFERALAFMAGYGIKAYIIVQDLTQLQSAYGKDESIMSNCHIRIAYAPNKIETAKTLSDMTGKRTVIQNKTSLSGNRSGHLGRASVSVSEVARPLLTPDECMRLPGAEKKNGKIVRPGDMLIFPAGFAPVYGKQILFFLDSEFLKRAQIQDPEKSDIITDTKALPPALDHNEDDENMPTVDELIEENQDYEQS